MVPLFLYSLKSNRLDLTKWILLQLKNESERTKLVNCKNAKGFNSVLAAIKSGSMETLQFVLSQKELKKADLVFATDQNGLSSLHYAVKTGQIGIFKAVLSIYEENAKGDCQSLMLSTKDNAGNNPFALAMKHSVSIGNLLKWVLYKFGDDLDSKLKLLFSENSNREVPLIEAYSNNVQLSTAYDYIYEYFSKIELVSGDNVELAARALMFLARFSGTISTMKMIIEKVKKNEKVFHEVLNATNARGAHSNSVVISNVASLIYDA